MFNGQLIRGRYHWRLCAQMRGKTCRAECPRLPQNASLTESRLVASSLISQLTDSGAQSKLLIIHNNAEHNKHKRKVKQTRQSPPCQTGSPAPDSTFSQSQNVWLAAAVELQAN